MLPVTTALLPSTSPPPSTSSLVEADVQRIAQAVVTILKNIETPSSGPLTSGPSSSSVPAIGKSSPVFTFRYFQTLPLPLCCSAKVISLKVGVGPLMPNQPSLRCQPCTGIHAMVVYSDTTLGQSAVTLSNASYWVVCSETTTEPILSRSMQ